MARPTSEASAATKRTAAVPEFSLARMGLGYDFYFNYLPELSGADLIRDIYLMAEMDETVGAMLYCINSTMRQVTYAYVPQVDGVDQPNDLEAKKYADLANTMLVDLNRPFPDHAEDGMTMVWAGYAPVEMVFKRRDGQSSRFNDGLYGIGDLNLIDQTTIWDFKYEDGRPVAMQQYGIGAMGSGIIPLSKTLLYRTNTAYNRPRGRSLLKSAWRAWRLKRKVQDSEAIGIERDLVGLPIFEMPEAVIEQQFEVDEAGNPTADATRARAMVTAATEATQDMRLNKTGGLVIPSDTFYEDSQGDTARKYNFRIQTTGGQRTVDSRTVVRDYDHAIARVAMMQFLTLGQRSGGSYGLSEDQSSMAVASMMALADRIVAEWDAKATRLFWSLNMLPAKYRPRLKHSDINRNTIVQLGQFLTGLAKSEPFWGGDVKMREGLARAGNLEYDHDAQAEAADTANEAAKNQALPPPAPVAPTPAAKPAAKPKE